MPINISRTPPPKTPARRAPAAKSAPPASAADARTKGLVGYVQIAQMGAIFKGWHADAETLSMYGAPFCREIANLAEEDENVAKYVDLFCAGGAYTALLSATVPMLLQLLANHNRIPASAVPGLVPPDILALRYMTKLQAERNRMEAEVADMRRLAEEDAKADEAEDSAE